jgi:hypothetical protein
MMRLLTLFFFTTAHFCYGQKNSEQYRRDILANKYIINTDIKDEFVKNDILILVKFTGYSIFYQGDPTDEERKRTAWILSGGAVFYLTILFILISTAE